MTPAEKFWNDAANNLTSDFKLTPYDCVFDVGGYLGNWTEFVHNKYRCQVVVFEPVPEFCDYMQLRFQGNPKITVERYGLEDETKQVKLATMGDATTAYAVHRADEKLVNIRDVVVPTRTWWPSLIAINGEGCEYKLLERLLKTQWLPQHLVIQFHNFVPDHEARRDAIRDQLRETHKENFNYPFVWESWSRK